MISYNYLCFLVGEPFRRDGQLFSIHAFIEKADQMKSLAFCLMSRDEQRLRQRPWSRFRRGSGQHLSKAMSQILNKVYISSLLCMASSARRVPAGRSEGLRVHLGPCREAPCPICGTDKSLPKENCCAQLRQDATAPPPPPPPFLPAAHIAPAVDALRAKATVAATKQLVDFVVILTRQIGVFSNKQSERTMTRKVYSKAECAGL
ncbi:LOW QUALITY PROTEIN: hypothetical protein MAR_004149, partial [Mya arenaria]